MNSPRLNAVTPRGPTDLSEVQETTKTGQRQVEPTIRRVPDERQASLVLLAGPTPGRRFRVATGMVVGRGSDTTVQLDDPEISRRHMVVRCEGPSFVVEDLGSRNGTLLNGLPLRAPRALSFGDKLQLGPRVVFLFTHYEGIEDELLRRQRLEALGRLGAGIAHDFNNVLATVVSCLDYLRALPKERTLGDPMVDECLSDVHQAIARAAELTPRMLAFAGASSGRQTLVDVGALCSEVTQLVSRTFDRSITVHAELAPGIVVRGDRIGLYQTLMNLCINARDAMPHGGTLQVSARLASAQESGSDTPQALITVGDTGMGMDVATRAQIFEPFFTTKGNCGGTGLGLATVHEVVTAHGGRVQVGSEVGRGTTFSVILPAVIDARNRLPSAITHENLTPVRPGAAPRPRGSVLLADDEPAVRRSMARILRADGYRVIEAADGLEALELYRVEMPRPELVLLDLDMPRMAGDEAQRRILALDPLARILFVSGHRSEQVEERLRVEGALGFVPKPSSRDAILQAVAAAMLVRRG
jgi:signal transduction histidine kinase/CheY-like chemotaxis protein